MWWVDFSTWNLDAAKLKAMWLPEANGLVGVLGDTWANQGIVVLWGARFNGVIDKCLGRVLQT